MRWLPTRRARLGLGDFSRVVHHLNHVPLAKYSTKMTTSARTTNTMALKSSQSMNARQCFTYHTPFRFPYSRDALRGQDSVARRSKGTNPPRLCHLIIPRRRDAATSN